MAVRDRRGCPRFERRFRVRIHVGQQTVTGRTETVGRHGIFVVTNAFFEPGMLVKIELDWGEAPDGQPLHVAAVASVSRVVSSTEAAQTDRVAGVGLNFFLIDGADKSAWDSVIDALSANPDAVARDEALETLEGASSEAESPKRLPVSPGPLRFLVRPRDMQQLRRFAMRELAAGVMFLRTPLVLGLRQQVQILLIHPVSEEEFPINGHVLAARNDGPVVQRGMDIRFDTLDESLRTRFTTFLLGELRPGRST